MPLLLIEYQPSDVDGWLDMFNRDPMNRAANGVTRHTIYQDTEREDTLVLALEFNSVAEAAAFRDVLKPVWDMSGAQRAWVLGEMSGSPTPPPR